METVLRQFAWFAEDIRNLQLTPENVEIIRLQVLQLYDTWKIKKPSIGFETHGDLEDALHNYLTNVIQAVKEGKQITSVFPPLPAI